MFFSELVGLSERIVGGFWRIVASNRDHTERDPDQGTYDGDLCECVTSFSAESTVASTATKGSCQTTPFSSLDEDQKDQPQRDKEQQ